MEETDVRHIIQSKAKRRAALPAATRHVQKPKRARHLAVLISAHCRINHLIFIATDALTAMTEY